MTVKENILKHKTLQKAPKYELVPPEGGWGYVVTFSVAVAFIVTVVPLSSFGLVYGNFLASVGDETGGTTLVNGVFNTVMSFTGLAANHLLQKYTYRKVALLGSCIYFLGNLATVLVQSLPQLIFTFGIVQGVGFGLVMPSAFSAFNEYFDKRKNLMMSICQALMVAATIGWPPMTKGLLEDYGFRGTVALYAALSLHALAAVTTLQPIEWHLVKKEITDMELQEVEKNSKGEIVKIEGEPLLEEKTQSETVFEKQKYNIAKARPSIVSLGSMALSVMNIHKIAEGDEEQEKLTPWQNFTKMLDLNLFKDPIYLNISLGLSLSVTSDMAFMSILPLLLTEFGYDTAGVTTLLTIYFSCDLASRILLSVANAMWVLRNRYIFLIGSLVSAILRTCFVMNGSYLWTVSTAASLGFFRCFIQTPLPLVIAEEYPDRFTTAFSLYMVVCGVVSLVVGLLLGFVKSLTGSNIMVAHMLTAAYLLCGIPWLIELFGEKLRKK